MQTVESQETLGDWIPWAIHQLDVHVCCLTTASPLELQMVEVFSIRSLISISFSLILTLQTTFIVLTSSSVLAPKK